MNTIFSNLLKEKIDNGEGSKIGWIFIGGGYDGDYRLKRLYYEEEIALDYKSQSISFAQLYELILKKKIELLNNYSDLKKNKYYLIHDNEREKIGHTVYTYYHNYITLNQLVLFIASYELGLHPFVVPKGFDEKKIEYFFKKNEIDDTDLILLSSGVTGKNQLKKVTIDSLFRDSKLDKYLINQRTYINSYLFYVTGILYSIISPIKNNSICNITINSNAGILKLCNFILLTPDDISFYYENEIIIETTNIKKIYLVGSFINDKTIEKIHKIFPNLSGNAILFAYASTENGIISLVEEKDFRFHKINEINCLSCGKIDSKKISISSADEILINGTPTGDYGKIYDNYLYVLGKHNEEIDWELQLSYKYNCQCLVYKYNDELVPVFELCSINNKYEIYKQLMEAYPNALFLYRFKRHATMKKILKKENVEFCKKNKYKCTFLCILKDMFMEDINREISDYHSSILSNFCSIDDRDYDWELEHIIRDEFSFYENSFKYINQYYVPNNEIKKIIIDYLNFVKHHLTLTPKNTMFFIKLSKDRVNNANSMRNALYQYKYDVKLNVMQTLKQVFGTEDIEEVINIIENEFKVEDELNNSK